MSGVQARCSHCGHVRRFSPELGGKYFRCPRCREGVLAVPRPSAEEAEAWESTRGAWLEESARSLGPKAVLLEDDESAEPAAERESSASAPGATALDSGSGDERPGAPDEAPAPFPLPARGPAPPAPARPAHPSRRGEVAAARQLMVECGLCQFQVRIPAEFFGKTVHCPECAGATVFSESTLEPVKDELLDRLMLETRERQLLFPPAETGRSRKVALRWLLLGLVLGGLVPGAVLLVREVDRGLGRRTRISEAEAEGWRWGLDTTALLIHEPWCVQLRHADKKVPAAELEARLREGYQRHECR